MSKKQPMAYFCDNEIRVIKEAILYAITTMSPDELNKQSSGLMTKKDWLVRCYDDFSSLQVASRKHFKTLSINKTEETK